MAAPLNIYPGDEVFVDDGRDIVAHVRRSNLREVFIFIEDTGDFTLPRDAVKSADDGRVVLVCEKLPMPFRAAIGHLHGEPDPRLIDED
jgi:hypothetical protein